MTDRIGKESLYIFTAMYQEAEPLIRTYGMRQRRRVLPFQQFEDPSGQILLTITGTGPAASSAAAGAVLGYAAAEVSCEEAECNTLSNRAGIPDAGENVPLDPHTGRNAVHAVLFGSAGAEDSESGRNNISGVDHLAEGVRKTADSLTERLYLGVRLRNMDSGRDFYPEPLGMQLSCGKREGGNEETTRLVPAIVETSARLWQRTDPRKAPENEGEAPVRNRGYCILSREDANETVRGEPFVLHDMEAAAWYEAAAHFLGPDRIHVLKFVSDSGDTGRLTSESIRKMAEQHMPAVRFYLGAILGSARAGTEPGKRNMQDSAKAKTQRQNIWDNAGSEPGRQNLPDKSDALDVDRLAEELCASATMRADLRKLYRYARLLPGAVWEEEISKKHAEGKIPCANRREGKKVLQEIKQELIDGPGVQEQKSEEQVAEPEIASRLVPAGPVVYVEEGIFRHPRTRRILDKLPNALVIPIRHYKDVFNRGKQNRMLQRQEHCLILAENTGRKVYPGAPVCQSFGNEWFYYTSSVLNCLFDCEYCYLKGMYTSGAAVIFVNLEDTFTELEDLLRKHPVYLCISYDTDLMALEALTGYVEEWMAFAAHHRNLKVEIRTKSGRRDLFRKWENAGSAESKSGTIFAYTISPEEVIRNYEHQTSSLQARLLAAKAAMEAGFPVRLCFDPMIYVPDWKSKYDRMLAAVADTIDLTKIWDISVGSFRISSSYLKQMRKAEPDSLVVQFPFDLTKGYYHYPEKLAEEMEENLTAALKAYVPEEKIFRWEDGFAERG